MGIYLYVILIVKNQEKKQGKKYKMKFRTSIMIQTSRFLCRDACGYQKRD